MTQFLRDRKLEERSKLTFEFPSVGGGVDTAITMPFFENLNITESKRARYEKYELLSRSSQLYTYLGAESRKLNLTFNLNFPHILDQGTSAALENYISTVSVENNEAERNRFFLKRDLEGVTQSLKQDAQKFTLDFFDQFTGFGFLPNTFFKEGSNPNQADSEERQDVVDSEKTKMINLVMYWMNIIRASVTNNSEQPIYGPPVVRLNHGIMFQNIPCICTDYNLEPVEAAGYDLQTMMPRQVKVTMRLEELRAGDYEKFEAGSLVKRDNLVGWEAIISSPHQSMDPGKYN